MNILSYFQARNEIVQEMSEEQVRRVLTISGRASEWIGVISKIIAEGSEESDVGVVECSGMGRKVLQITPREEWVNLINPSLAGSESLVVEDGIVTEGKLFSPAVFEWLQAQEIGVIYRLSEKVFTGDEAKVMRLMWSKQEAVCEREEIAAALWGENWLSLIHI